MSYLQIFKRIIPFFLTFAAGLLIASIFVPINGPGSFRNADRGAKWRYHRECKREKEALRNEIDRLRQELEQTRANSDAKLRTLELSVPEIHVDAPVPPPPSHRVK